MKESKCEFCMIECPKVKSAKEKFEKITKDLLARAEAAEAEVEKLKNCRHECKIVCLLEKYNKMQERAEKAEKEIHRLRDIMWEKGFIPFPPDD